MPGRMQISPVLAHAMLDVLSAIQQRDGAKMPSHDVQRKAAAIPADRISHHAGPTQLYHVRNDAGIEYAVILHMASSEPSADIIEGECTCDAGRARTMCKHLLRVLAQAQFAGHNLQS